VRRIASVWKVDCALRPAIDPASSSEQLPKILIFSAALCSLSAYHAKQRPAFPALSIHQQTLGGFAGFRRDPEVILARMQGCFLAATVLACAAAQGFGQVVKTVLLNQQGATAPCTGIGPVAAPVAKKCVTLFEQAGFIASNQVGYSGLTISTTGSNDGAITAVDPQSPGASAGFQVGDAITAVGGKPVAPTPGMMAAKAVFGLRGDTLHLTLKRGGSAVSVSLVRAAATAPAGPTTSGFMTEVKEMITWQNQFAPCIGMGPAAAAAIQYCYSHFKPFGFIRADQLGSTGFQIDLANKSKALITTVDPGSPASQAGIEPGDEIVAVEGQPLTASRGEAATEMLFGKTGDQLEVTIQRGKASSTIPLVLAAKAK
jgi:membrane-associated protease RseP (regulator of RpoE activity)